MNELLYGCQAGSQKTRAIDCFLGPFLNLLKQFKPNHVKRTVQQASADDC